MVILCLETASNPQYLKSPDTEAGGGSTPLPPRHANSPPLPGFDLNIIKILSVENGEKIEF